MLKKLFNIFSRIPILGGLIKRLSAIVHLLLNARQLLESHVEIKQALTSGHDNPQQSNEPRHDRDDTFIPSLKNQLDTLHKSTSHHQLATEYLAFIQDQRFIALERKSNLEIAQLDKKIAQLKKTRSSTKK